MQEPLPRIRQQTICSGHFANFNLCSSWFLEGHSLTLSSLFHHPCPLFLITSYLSFRSQWPSLTSSSHSALSPSPPFQAWSQCAVPLIRAVCHYCLDWAEQLTSGWFSRYITQVQRAPPTYLLPWGPEILKGTGELYRGRCLVWLHRNYLARRSVESMLAMASRWPLHSLEGTISQLGLFLMDGDSSAVLVELTFENFSSRCDSIPLPCSGISILWEEVVVEIFATPQISLCHSHFHLQLPSPHVCPTLLANGREQKWSI